MAIVEATGLVKRFGATEALRGLDLEVERGTVLGLLGPNGAGKTTAVRILTTLLRPDAGSVVIDGVNVLTQPRRVRELIGLTGQYAAVDERLTARENLELVARFFRLTGSQPRLRAGELLRRFDLSDAADRVVKHFSGGMRRRLDIAMSLVARPKVLFLDEPTTGLDPRSRLAMWDLIDDLVASGTTTLLTTQYLEEADRLAREIVVVDHGTAIARGTADELKGRLGGERVTITLRPDNDPLAVAAALTPHALVDEPVARVGRQLVVRIRPNTSTIDIVHDLDAASIVVDDVSIDRPTLDDVFLALTGRTTELEEVGSR